MAAARELVERAAHGSSEHTYGVNTGFGRFVSQSIPEELTEELQLRLLRSHACGVGEPYPDEVVRAAMLLRANALAKGYSGARDRDGRAPARVPRTAACSRTSRRAARSARAAISRRSRISRCRSSARARRGSTASGSPGAEALAPRRPRADRARSEGGALADQRHAVHGGDGALGARPRAAARAGRRPRVRALARGAAGIADELPPADPRAAAAARARRDSAANVLRLLEGSAIIESHRWCDKVQDAYSLRCAPQVHGACRDLLDYVETPSRSS